MANVTKHNSRRVTRIDNSFGKYSPDAVARPVDTFISHQAPANAGGEYMALAQSLSSISPQLNAFLKHREEERQARDEAKGQKLYLESGKRLSWEDYRKSIPTIPGINTAVRNGYLKARMANEANLFRTALNDAYASGEAVVELQDGTKIPVAESDDPAVFNLWMNRFTSSYIRDNLGEGADPEYFVKDFIPQVEAAGQELGSRHITERNHVLWNRNIAEHHKLMTSALDGMIQDGGINTSTESMNQTAAELGRLARSLSKSGVPSRMVQDVLVKTLITASLNPDLDNGEELYDLAEQIDMGGGKSLWDSGDTAYVLTKGAEDVRKERHYLQLERKQIEREEKEKQRINLENAIADHVLRGVRPPAELLMNLRRDHGVRNLSALMSNLRNILHGYAPDSGGGGGGRGEGQRSKTQKAYAESIKIKYLRERAAGSESSVLDALRDPDVAALSYADQKAIFGLYAADIQETSKELKDMADGNKDIINAELNNEAVDPGAVSYLKDVAFKQAALRVHILLKDHPALVSKEPEKFRDTVRNIYREAARETKANSEALLAEGYGGHLPANDPDIIQKTAESKKQAADQTKVQQSAALQSLIEEMLAEDDPLETQ